MSRTPRLLRRLLISAGLILLTVALLAWLAVPALAAAFGPQALERLGLRGTDTKVELRLGPTAMVGQVEGVTISSDDLDLAGHGQAGHLEMTLSDLDAPARTFGLLALAATDITIISHDGLAIHGQSLQAEGPSREVTAIAKLSWADLLALTISPTVSKRLGFAATALASDGADGFVARTADGEVRGHLSVDDRGTLWLIAEGREPVALYTRGENADDASWLLTKVSLDGDGATASAVFDLSALMGAHPGYEEFSGNWLPR